MLPPVSQGPGRVLLILEPIQGRSDQGHIWQRNRRSTSGVHGLWYGCLSAYQPWWLHRLCGGWQVLLDVAR